MIKMLEIQALALHVLKIFTISMTPGLLCAAIWAILWWLDRNTGDKNRRYSCVTCKGVAVPDRNWCPEHRPVRIVEDDN
jgi:hypothetical protein